MTVDVVIFDLDGTLIDSSQSILESYQAAFEQVGCHLAQPLTRSIVGPPLDETMAMLAGGSDAVTLDALISAFKAHYDTAGYKKADVFHGIVQLLDELLTAGVPMYVATNKRIAPTRNIICHLGWERYFKGVFALDSFASRLGDKAHLISRLLETERLTPASALYVGDRDEDALAAERAQVGFERATWGYGVDPLLQDSRESYHLIARLGIRLRWLTSTR